MQKEADRKSQRELINLKIREAIETDRLKLKNLELDDQIAVQKGRPAKNRRAIALLKSHIEVNETSLRLDAGMSGATFSSTYRRSLQSTG